LGTKDLATSIGGIINAALTILGIIFLALIVYAGFTWLLARGREEEVQRAQKIIETSIIGLIIVILAYAISKFVFSVVISGAGVQ
jgi:cytochrome bd-type quinol oxidase subunit 2